MTVRAKFRATTITTSANNYGGITLTINNPAAFEQFKVGECYFVDFTEAPAKESDEGKAAG